MLISPYLKISKIGKHINPLFHLYPDFVFPQPDLGSEELASRKTVPILIIHGDNDPILPVAQADKIYEMAKGPKRYIRVPNGWHVGGLAAGAEPFCKEWFAELNTMEVLSKSRNIDEKL
jgi:alpha-beta hydrolase superfamily lysophospholipase